MCVRASMGVRVWPCARAPPGDPHGAHAGDQGAAGVGQGQGPQGLQRLQHVLHPQAPQVRHATRRTATASPSHHRLSLCVPRVHPLALFLSPSPYLPLSFPSAPVCVPPPFPLHCLSATVSCYHPAHLTRTPHRTFCTTSQPPRSGYASPPPLAVAHTLRHRRHHCRLCGDIYCRECSSRQLNVSRLPFELAEGSEKAHPYVCVDEIGKAFQEGTRCVAGRGGSGPVCHPATMHAQLCPHTCLSARVVCKRSGPVRVALVPPARSAWCLRVRL